ncbi:MAG: hypothetical protein ABF915_10925, partial [Schleiferilactobacillus harbinensis]
DDTPIKVNYLLQCTLDWVGYYTWKEGNDTHSKPIGTVYTQSANQGSSPIFDSKKYASFIGKDGVKYKLRDTDEISALVFAHHIQSPVQYIPDVTVK